MVPSAYAIARASLRMHLHVVVFGHTGWVMVEGVLVGVVDWGLSVDGLFGW